MAWSHSSTRKLIEMRKLGVTVTECALTLGVTLRAAESRLRRLRFLNPNILAPGPIEATFSLAPEIVEAMHEARYRAQPRTLTAVICGDPLPGYSALDRKLALA